MPPVMPPQQQAMQGVPGEQATEGVKQEAAVGETGAGGAQQNGHHQPVTQALPVSTSTPVTASA